jgi:hypothetical protein
MSIEDHPNVFRFEGKLWVSEAPAETGLAQLTAQRAWDAQNIKLQRWWIAIGVGAVVGTVGTLGLGTLIGLAPVVYLVLLPVGFGIGAVLGALVNRRFFAPELRTSDMPARPIAPMAVKVPPRVVAKAPSDASADQLIRWSLQRYVD